MLQWRTETDSLRDGVARPALAKLRPSSLNGLLEGLGIAVRYERDSEIFAEDDEAEYIYRVVRGAVRLSKLMSDGRRQIGAFYLPGDVFGLEAEDHYAFSAESIGDAEILLVKRSVLVAEAVTDPAMARQLWVQTVDHLRQAQAHMLLLGRKNAQERVAAFLMEMAERLHSAGSVELPMSRQDIADYLGLTIETVSRTLTQLERNGVIGIPVSRLIVLRNRPALEIMNDRLAA
jgi:CRP/FNR family transcriptional regulator, nitrogen fixation regulation protein